MIACFIVASLDRLFGRHISALAVRRPGVSPRRHQAGLDAGADAAAFGHAGGLDSERLRAARALAKGRELKNPPFWTPWNRAFITRGIPFARGSAGAAPR